MSALVASTRVSLSAPGGATSSNLGFSMQTQLQSNWCWAAVSVSTSKYYLSTSKWTQCKVVNAELTQTSCCKDGSTAACDKPWYLDRALGRTGNLNVVTSGTIAFSVIQTEVNAKRPVATRIGWSGGGGHFVVIDGYNSTTQSISVRDPFYGSSTYTLTAFTTKYRQTGSWTHTYKTQS